MSPASSEDTIKVNIHRFENEKSEAILTLSLDEGDVHITKKKADLEQRYNITIQEESSLKIKKYDWYRLVQDEILNEGESASFKTPNSPVTTIRSKKEVSGRLISGVKSDLSQGNVKRVLDQEAIFNKPERSTLVNYGPKKYSVADALLNEIFNELLTGNNCEFNLNEQKEVSARYKTDTRLYQKDTDIPLPILFEIANFNHLSTQGSGAHNTERKFCEVFNISQRKKEDMMRTFSRSEDRAEGTMDSDSRDRLSFAEKASIYYYTGSFYKEFNQFLRTGKIDRLDNQSVEKNMLCCFFLNSAIYKTIPPNPMSVIRGEANLPHDVKSQWQENFQQGELTNISNPLSTSSKLMWWFNGNNTLIIRDSRLHQLLSTYSQIPGESERLLPSNLSLSMTHHLQSGSKSIYISEVRQALGTKEYSQANYQLESNQLTAIQPEDAGAIKRIESIQGTSNNNDLSDAIKRKDVFILSDNINKIAFYSNEDGSYIIEECPQEIDFEKLKKINTQTKQSARNTPASSTHVEKVTSSEIDAIKRSKGAVFKNEELDALHKLNAFIVRKGGVGIELQINSNCENSYANKSKKKLEQYIGLLERYLHEKTENLESKYKLTNILTSTSIRIRQANDLTRRLKAFIQDPSQENKKILDEIIQSIMQDTYSMQKEHVRLKSITQNIDKVLSDLPLTDIQFKSDDDKKLIILAAAIASEIANEAAKKAGKETSNTQNNTKNDTDITHSL